MKKIRIKVEYEGGINTSIDTELVSKMEGVGAKWYAQGKDMKSGIRDICFDLEINK